MEARLVDSPPVDYALKAAILLYSAKNDLYSTERTIAMQHPIHEVAGGPMLGAGVAVTESFFTALLETTGGAPLTYIAPHVVASSRSAIAWIEPAGTRTCYFKCSDEAVKEFDGCSIPLPALLFIARRGNLSVFALKSNARPGPKAPLYHAPLYNVYDNGNMCVGTTALPETLSMSDTSAWTKAFFASEFTHISGAAARWNHPGTYAELLRDAVKKKKFENAWLRPSPYTLDGALCQR